MSETQQLKTVNMKTPIWDLKFSNRVKNTFRRNNVNTIGDLVALSQDDLLWLRNFGQTSYREVAEFLNEHGLHLGMKAHEQPPRKGGELMEYDHSLAMLNVFKSGLDDIAMRILETLGAMVEPHVLMKPKVYWDGDHWCCQLGNDISGIHGFGDTPENACSAFDMVWREGVNSQFKTSEAEASTGTAPVGE